MSFNTIELTADRNHTNNEIQKYTSKCV